MQQSKILTPHLNKPKVQRSPLAIVQSVLVAYLCVWCMSPPLSIGTMYRLIALGCAVLWFILAFIRGFSLKRNEQISLVLVALVVLVSVVVNAGFSKVISEISVFMLFIGFCMISFYKDRTEELEFIPIIILILASVWNVNTWKALADNPKLARLIVRDDESIYQYLRQGIGGYGLIYGQVCIFPLILSWILTAFKRNKFKFAVGAIWVVTYMMLVFVAGYSIAVSGTFIGMIILFIYRGKAAVPALLICIAIFGGAMLLILYNESFRNLLLEIFDGTTVTKKIQDLMSSNADGAAEGSIAVRLERYKASVECFFTHPIFGALWTGGAGGHSAVMDMFAVYGIFFGYWYARMITVVPRTMKLYTDKWIIRTANALMVSILYVAILDTFPYDVIMMVTMVALSMMGDLVRWRTGRDEKDFVDGESYSEEFSFGDEA